MENEGLLSTGEFAKIASTTSRTIRYYDKNEILNPVKVNSKGYRFYKPEQVLDFQIILLLRKLGVSIKEIKENLDQRDNLKALFKKKQKLIKNEIMQLKYMHDNLVKYYENLEENSTLVSPKYKKIDSFKIYSMTKVGSYSKIADYCKELCSFFTELPDKVTTLTVFHDNYYSPKKSNMEIGVKYHAKLKLDQKYKQQVKLRMVKGFDALTYMHNGSGSTLSLFWKELEKYARLNKIELDDSIPSLEFYHSASEKDYEQFFEIVQPVKI